jgi:PAS domain S-box-containing protein
MADPTPLNLLPEETQFSEEIFRLFVDAVRDYAIFALDPNGFVLTWNSGAARLKGYKADEIIGSHFSRFYTEPDLLRNHPQWELDQALTNGSYEEEGWRVRKDGSRFWASVIITTVRDRTGRHLGFSKVTRDLTERKIAETRLREANRSLEIRVQERTAALERAVAAREEFFSIASHELRTPLTALRFKTQHTRRLIEKAPAADPEFRKFAEDVDGQVNRLVKLVDDMLDLTRLTQGKILIDPVPFDLNELIQEMLERMEPLFSSRATPLTARYAEPNVVVADRSRIDQVLQNLLTNALRYAPGKPVEMSVRSVNRFAEVRVRDHGPGIAAEFSQRVFERYERLSRSAGSSGLGLGLYLARSLVEAHHGTIQVETPPDGGACFVVRLPLAD